MIHLYRPGSSLVHRAPAGLKLCVLMVMALLLSLIPWDAWGIGAALLLVGALYGVAGFGVRALGAELWRIRWLVLVLGAALAIFLSPVTAWISTGRVVALLLLASLLTLTTPMSALLETLYRVLQPLRRVGVDADAVAMTLSLTLTMIPVVAGFAQRVRDAQDARGVRLGVRASVPLLVLALRHADDVGDALAARGLV
ncbi:MAG: energy-coupling factor transporter transmembrane protein EcfT [Candidatus Microbacterium colombiense]|nr:MAG: energy-coupling factor transporter transmembrane protein EcfT [Microbacterium sp.]